MKTFLFFDLEQTLIPDWTEDRETLLPLMFPELKEWIFSQFPFTAGLLSFAVWNDHDLQDFNKNIRPNIEEHLHFKFDDELILTRDQISTWLNVWNKTPFNTADENMDMHKKHGVMQSIWKNKFTQDDTRVILLDDVVEDMIIHRSSILPMASGQLTHSKPVINNSLEFVNPWSIIRQ